MKVSRIAMIAVGLVAIASAAPVRAAVNDVLVGYANDSFDVIHQDNSAAALTNPRPQVINAMAARSDGSVILGYATGAVDLLDSSYNDLGAVDSRGVPALSATTLTNGNMLVGFNSALDVIYTDNTTATTSALPSGYSPRPHDITALAPLPGGGALVGYSSGDVDAISATFAQVAGDVDSRPAAVLAMASRSDGTTLVSYANASLDVIDPSLSASAVSSSLLRGSNNVTALAALPDGQFILGWSNGAVDVTSTDLSSATNVQGSSGGIASESAAVAAIAVRSDGSFLVGYADGNVYAWRTDLTPAFGGNPIWSRSGVAVTSMVTTLAVPEPATLGLIGVGGLLMMLPRRRRTVLA